MSRVRSAAHPSCGGGFVAVAFASQRTFTSGVECTFELTAASGTNYRSTPQLRALNPDFNMPIRLRKV